MAELKDTADQFARDLIAQNIAGLMMAFTPEGMVGLRCEHCAEEEYHVWDQDVAVVTRRRGRGDGTDVDALLWTTLAEEAPRVLVNVEHDDQGVVRHEVPCSCPARPRHGCADRARRAGRSMGPHGAPRSGRRSRR